MNNLPTIVGVIGGVFGVLSLIAGAAVYLRASYAAARIAALNAEVEEANRRSAALRLDVTALQAENRTLTERVAALKELVTQRAQIERLEAAIEQLRIEIRTQTSQIHSDIRAAVDRVARESGPR